MTLGAESNDVGWSTVFDGLNEVSRKIYFMLYEQLEARGLRDVLEGGASTLSELRERLGVPEEVAHRFLVALQALRAIGVLKKDPGSLFVELGRIVRHRGKLVIGAFHSDKPCFSKPALHLHRNLFDPPAFAYPVESVKDWLREVGFETNIAVEFGSYCTIYAEKMPEVLPIGLA